MSKRKEAAGFSLIEMMIALAIFGFIGMIIFQATFQTYRLRDNIGVDVDFTTSIRVAFLLIERDIALQFSPLGFVSLPQVGVQTSQSPGTVSNAPVTAVKPFAVITAGPGAGSGRPKFVAFRPQESYQSDFVRVSEFWSAAVDQYGTRPSRFQGTEKKMSFVTMSHVRIYRDSLQSEFAKVTYELVKDTAEGALAPLMLVKTEDAAAFAGDDFHSADVKKQTILRGIEKFKMSYFLRDGKTWKKLNSWDSDRDENNYLPPDKIELEVVIKGDKSLVYAATHAFRYEIPFNGIPMQF
jgi:prepilin-type N-terminal cleavage/methylation domain-containing protein